MEIKNTLWVEKYRPTDLTTYVADDSFKGNLQRFLDEKDVPHLLLAGKAGTGKTTASKILYNTLPCEYIYINGSLENGIDTIRNKILNFASIHGFEDLKIIAIDECDYLSPNAQASLRVLMEQFSDRVRFVMTCNYIEKIIDPIISRCQVFELTPPNKAQVAEFVDYVLNEENIEYNMDDLATVVNTYFPDIRKCIQIVQQSSLNGKLKLTAKNLIRNDYVDDIMSILKNKSDKKSQVKNVRQAIANTKQNDFTELYTFLFNNIDEYGKGNIGEIMLILDDGQYKETFVADRQLHITRVLIEIISVL